MKIEDEIKSNFDNEHHKALVNLIYTNYQIAFIMRQNFKKYDITSQQYNILRILKGQYPDAASIGLLKERMLDKSSDVSRIVDRLLLKKYISRTECKTDRRQKDVIISKKGINLLEEMTKEEKNKDHVLKNLSIEEAQHLNFLLDKIRK